MLIIHHHHTVFATAAEAEAVAAANNAGDEDGWAYAVKLDPAGTGKAVVEVYDEAGFLVGML